MQVGVKNLEVVGIEGKTMMREGEIEKGASCSGEPFAAIIFGP